MYPDIYPVDPQTKRRLSFISNNFHNTCRPILSATADRKESILKNTVSFFNISNNFQADGSEPLFEASIFDQTKKYSDMIDASSLKYNVDAGLIRAVMYMETTHGYYDSIYPLRVTVLPMNIHYKYWKELAINEKTMENPSKNIDVGALLLKRIQDRVTDPTVAKIASIYNVLGREIVNQYGARVATIYKKITQL
ncbi:hypothetical protein ONV78_22075 [Hahella sp. CR1]|uniref:hypothetical protein n=1 Tax=Hahella sp. CR1 TaxID=2992807 RepID=UPI0024415509|nr:hypothetical protein [Hahella sp. CR1]MDG9670442.1 hypothetical protein [Hahella sp. CR1]